MSVVVDDLDVSRSLFRPYEADPVLTINANAVLALPVCGQCFESVSWRDAKVFYVLDGIQLIQFSSGDFP